MDARSNATGKFRGCVQMTRATRPYLKATEARIINPAGIKSRAGCADFTIGGSVNIALLNFAKAMSNIVIHQGVRVNAINPGLITTERFARNVDHVIRERTRTRDDALQFLLTLHGTK